LVFSTYDKNSTLKSRKNKKDHGWERRREEKVIQLQLTMITRLVYIETGASAPYVEAIEGCLGGREQDMQQKTDHTTHLLLRPTQNWENCPKKTRLISSTVHFKVVEVKMATTPISLMRLRTTMRLALTSLMTRILHMKVQMKKVPRRTITKRRRCLIHTRIAIL
jgi:hypothetical protein